MHSRLEANLCKEFPLDLSADAAQSLENRDRYLAQSRSTKAGARAELPERAPVPLFVFHYED